jgi:hypothetical protein
MSKKLITMILDPIGVGGDLKKGNIGAALNPAQALVDTLGTSDAVKEGNWAKALNPGGGFVDQLADATGNKNVQNLDPVGKLLEDYSAKQDKDNANADLPPAVADTVTDIGNVVPDTIQVQSAKRRLSRLAKYYTSAQGVFTDAKTGTTKATVL